jgi:hypothetical protein
MNGAEALLQTLVDSGVEVCFANPGTSEMQLVAAIGRTDAMRPVLCLFEGVVSGAADGYARMADKPAATLLHLGSGFSNSLANMHNAKRAGSPIVNIVGDHASYHLQFDAPLTSDLPGIARWASHWTETADSPDALSAAGARAVQAALARQRTDRHAHRARGSRLERGRGGGSGPSDARGAGGERGTGGADQRAPACHEQRPACCSGAAPCARKTSRRWVPLPRPPALTLMCDNISHAPAARRGTRSGATPALLRRTGGGGAGTLRHAGTDRCSRHRSVSSPIRTRRAG